VKKEDVKIERQTPIAIWRRCGKIVAADFGPRDSDDIAGGSGLRIEDGKLRIERQNRTAIRQHCGESIAVDFCPRVPKTQAGFSRG
jgi:hypothetical protein